MPIMYPSFDTCGTARRNNWLMNRSCSQTKAERRGEERVNEKMQEALRYFDSPTYVRLFKLFKEKYESLGYIGGSISLETFSNDEISVLAMFFALPNRKVKE